MELREVMRSTPSVREFTDEPVPEEVVHRILEVARFAPSGGNRQGWRVIVVKDPAVRAELRHRYDLSWREYMAHRRLGAVPFAPRDAGRWPGPLVDLEVARATPSPSPLSDHLHEAPVVLVVCAILERLACMDNGLDRQSIVGGASIYPFVQNILLAARDEGLGGVMATVLCRQEDAVNPLLGLPPGVVVAATVALGHPRARITKLRRAPVEDFAVVDRWDGHAFTAPA